MAADAAPSGDAPWQAETEILRVDRAVRDALGIKHRCGDMIQPWAQKPPVNPKRVTVTLAYTFECKALPSGDLFLALEEPQTFRVSLNGNPVTPTSECGWWVDRSLRKLPVSSAFLKLGANEIVLECDYPETHRGLEIVYLLGNFGTAVDRNTGIRLGCLYESHNRYTGRSVSTGESQERVAGAGGARGRHDLVPGMGCG